MEEVDSIRDYLVDETGGVGSGRRCTGSLRVLLERATAARLRVDVEASTRGRRELEVLAVMHASATEAPVLAVAAKVKLDDAESLSALDLLALSTLSADTAAKPAPTRRAA